MNNSDHTTKFNLGNALNSGRESIYKFRENLVAKFNVDAVKSKRNIVIGMAFLAIGSLVATYVVYLLLSTGFQFYEGQYENHPIASLVLFTALTILVGLVSLLFICIGSLLLAHRSRIAHRLGEISVAILALCILCELMLEGLTQLVFVFVVVGGIILALFTLIDPSLSEERKLQHKLRDMKVHEEAIEGTLGRSEDGKGYIALNFFNLFWIFTIAAIFGDAIETVYHYMIEVPGEFEIRAGLLWGPFSPIYGFGAVLLTLILNRFYKAPVIVIFFISAVVGGAFEYLTSWFLEFGFGILAWDYTGRFLNIGGRTDFMFMCMWGVLGVIWIKWMLPQVLKIVNLIPWQIRYSLTTVCAALMIFDCIMTLGALDCWYMRLAGVNTSDIAYTQFYADHFDNSFMESRFQTMGIDASRTTRVN